MVKSLDILKPEVAFSTKNPNEFMGTLNILRNKGYIINKENIVLDQDGTYSLLAFLSEDKDLVRCLLKEKKIPENDRVYPPCYSTPSLCEYHVNGICSCVNTDICLYQATDYHIDLIKKMVKCYDSNDRSFHDNCSTYFEDTELGRIFSNEFEHLNDPNIYELAKNIGRMYGR